MKGEDKLKALRELMKQKGYDAYIIPHGDQHNNEYLAEPDERIKFISNFSGSNGIGLVTQNTALMWTDGRYYIQIEKELYPGWKMKKLGQNEESLTQYVSNNLSAGSTIGFDYSLMTHEKAKIIKLSLKDYKFIDDTENIIDAVWGKDKPTYKGDKLMILSEKLTGMSVENKLNYLDKYIKSQYPNLTNYRLFTSKLDNIAWLLNLRGNDIQYNPLFFSYVFLYNDSDGLYVHLFINKDKVDTKELQEYCKNNKIKIFDYSDMLKELKEPKDGITTLIDEKFSNHRIILSCENIKYIITKSDTIEFIKSIKNQTEIEGFKKANLKDSVALIKFFAWIEDELLTKGRTDLNEYEIGLKNKQVREDQENFMGESFHPICACGPNAAIIHYSQSATSHSNISKNLILLCDTGAQYLEGTTDITRTVHYGKPTEKEKEMYTRVLLGNLSFERLIFPKNYTLAYLDAVPRFYLNIVNEDYLHSTSHGVGHFLNVHEGPRGGYLYPGRIITNEPGYYAKDKFGIRIENEILVVDKGNNKLGFENLTLLPYERNLIDMNLISNEFKKYIDDFHKKVFDTLSPYLKGDEKSLDYLKRKTQPL